jgi:L-ascorbate metabolism protein UlaG (beta-lactamase superfamily)
MLNSFQHPDLSLFLLHGDFMNRQPHRFCGRFYNNNHDSMLVRIKHMFRAFWEIGLHRSKVRSTKELLLNAQGVLPQWLEPAVRVVPSSQTSITWLGHATFLIQVDGFTILTDPVFYEISSFVKRFFKAPIMPDQLPPIDVILISHNHRDHMDEASLNLLKHMNPRILTPAGTKRWFAKRGFANVQEFGWGDGCQVNKEQRSITCSFLPAAHWSGRNLWDTNKSLWGSWMISSTVGNIYFAGDTAYGDHFTAIKNKFGSIWAAILPIGPIRPRWLMDESHLDGQQAARTFADLDAQHFFPMHWGTFMFGMDFFIEPMLDLQDQWQKMGQQFAHKQLHVVKCGEQRFLDSAGQQKKEKSVYGQESSL